MVTTLEEAKKIRFKSNLNEIKKGRHKSDRRKSLLHIIGMIYNVQERIIKFFDDYSTITSEVRQKATKGEGIRNQN